MPIPAFDEFGLLPDGIHDCTLNNIRTRFGSFDRTDQRPRLFAKLSEFASAARTIQIVRGLLVDGSFVTAKSAPNDIDLIVAAGHDFSAELTPSEYSVLSKLRVHRQFGFDLLVARENSVELRRWVDFFAQVRVAPERRKGILRLSL